jgi:sulfite exporter TauE/SafE/copper chaperone CopZ
MHEKSFLYIELEGMVCSGCELRVNNILKDLNGVTSVKSSFKDNCVIIEYQKDLIYLSEIKESFDSTEYTVLKTRDIKKEEFNNLIKKENNKLLVIGLLLIVITFYFVINNTVGFDFIPEINDNMSYGVLFIIGLLTSLHCISMCGGINMTVCMNFNNSDENNRNYKASFLYNFGRVISYTIIGGIVGGIGSIIGFNGSMKVLIAFLSGAFMIILGIKLLNIIPIFRKINIKIPGIIGNKVYKNLNSKGPLYVGLLNGFMPCGPLQTMQLYALGTGSIIVGSLSMMFFSLGTFPLMFLLGIISSLLNKNFTKQLMRVSAVLIIVLGFIMINRGFSLAGLNLNLTENSVFANDSSDLNIAKINGDVQEVEMSITNGDYYPIYVQKGIPVKWNIKAKESELTGCNNSMTIPEYNISKDLSVGDNYLEFTPTKSGKIVYTCWMGMITSNINVVDDINSIDEESIKSEQQNAVEQGNTGAGCACCSGE